MSSRILRKCIGRTTESLLGLVALWVILLPSVGSAQTPSATPTPLPWVTSGCADFYPKWNSRELPDTPENEHRAEACLRMSPFDAMGCPQLFQKLSEEHRAGIAYSDSDRSALESCFHHIPRNSTKPGLTFGRPSPGRAYTSHVPLPPSPPQHFISMPTPRPTPSNGPVSSLSSPSSVSLSGPSTLSTFTEFPGGEMQAAPTASPSAVPQGQPPDVSADASPNFNAEFLNGGFWIFNKDGSSGCSNPNVTQNTTTPCIARGSFWPNQPKPVDPQIAWDPVIQRWIATALSGTSTLLFAYSAGDDPNPGNWTQSSTTICSGNEGRSRCLGRALGRC